jgi:hypothetical protein
VRTTVDIEPRLLRRLRDEAHRRGSSFKALLNQVLRRGLEEPRTQVPPYRCPAASLGQPLRPLDKALALADALEGDEVARELVLRK